MSRVPMGSDGGAWAMDPETAYDTYFMPQGVSADLIATIEGFSRDDVDAYAVRSQERAANAWAAAASPSRSSRSRTATASCCSTTTSTCVRAPRSTTLAKLKPSFAMMGEMGGFDAVALQKYHWVEGINHVHTGGNSSGIVDGAAMVLIGNEQVGKDAGLTPRGRIVASAVIGSEPTIMLTGPTPATEKVLRTAGLKDRRHRRLRAQRGVRGGRPQVDEGPGHPPEKVNVNGGAIAMGHPLGATGAMIIGSVLDELERTGGRYGLVTLCIGGGMGVATIIERL